MRDLQVHLDDHEHVEVHFIQNGKPVVVWIGQEESYCGHDGRAGISIGINTSNERYNDGTTVWITNRAVSVVTQ